MLRILNRNLIVFHAIFVIGTIPLLGSMSLSSQDLEKRFDPPPPQYKIRSERNIMVPMRDGVKLATDIWFPVDVEEKLPVILVRTPYMKDGHPTVRFVLYGYAIVVQGAFRARYREGFDKKVWMKPGDKYRIEVELHSTSYCFASGHRIRLDITSSDFPIHERNLNTGGNNYDETKWIVARNMIYHSKKYPSHVLLPVIQ